LSHYLFPFSFSRGPAIFPCYRTISRVIPPRSKLATILPGLVDRHPRGFFSTPLQFAAIPDARVLREPQSDQKVPLFPPVYLLLPFPLMLRASEAQSLFSNECRHTGSFRMAHCVVQSRAFPSIPRGGLLTAPSSLFHAVTHDQSFPKATRSSPFFPLPFPDQQVKGVFCCIRDGPYRRPV